MKDFFGVVFGLAYIVAIGWGAHAIGCVAALIWCPMRQGFRQTEEFMEGAFGFKEIQ